MGIPMKSLFLLLLLAATAAAQTPMTSAEFFKFATEFNNAQYEQAKKNASSTFVTIGSDNVTSFRGYRQFNMQHTYSERTYELNRYGGGPVWIINPFCPPKSFR